MDSFNTAKGFIFDCDGTLLDTLDAWEVAEADLFAQTGPLTQEQEDEIHSAPIAEAARIFHERYGVMDSAEEVLAHLDGHLLPYYGNVADPLPGACEFVRKISGGGVPCVVLSSSPRRYLEAGLKRAGILECFVDLVSTEDVGCSKQDFKIYEHALEVLGSKASETWAVDDAPYAIQVMSSFGLNTIGVGNGCSSERAELLSKHAKLFVNTLEEL